MAKPSFAVDRKVEEACPLICLNLILQEIIAGMMDLPADKWRKKKPQSFKEVKDKCDALKAAWEPYDWTKRIDRSDR
ncbi:hypothetical protein COOONC_13790 [Cooperia oncophora]